MSEAHVQRSEMMMRLNYGRGEVVAIEPSQGAVCWLGAPRGGDQNASALDDPVAAVAAALDDPLEYPPLASTIAPGDRVAIALAAQVPQATAIVAGVVFTLLASENGAESIEVVYDSPAASPSGESSSGEDAFDPLKLIPESQRGRVSAARHDPADRGALSYLAASREARPIYFNRKLLDADMVVPVGVSHPSRRGALGGALFPAFSDRETQLRYSETIPIGAASKVDGAASKVDGAASKLDRETDESIWLLGAQFLVQATPGPGDTLLAIHAGERHAVATKAAALCDAVWEYEAPRRFDLAIAAIDGGPAQQTWRSFARALENALELIVPGGAIVICSEIAAAPGPALKLLAHPRGREAGLKALRKLHSFDVEPAQVLFDALERARVYLLSNLPQEAVEDLGLAHVSSPEEIARLARSSRSCAMIASAQHAAVFVAE